MTSRRLVVVVAVSALVALAASAAWAHCGACGPKKEAPALTGIIKRINAPARSIVLTTGSGKAVKDVAMTVSPTAKITVNGKAATLADVKTGMKAQIRQKKTKQGILLVFFLSAST